MATYQRTCQQCGTEFVSKNGFKKYCSQPCMVKAYSKDRETKVCPTCGKSFQARIGRNRKVCSRACIRKGQKPKQVQICEGCGEEFEAHVSDGRIFCSKQCYTDAHRITCTCDGCGKLFSVSLTDKQGEKKFCSVACFRNRGRTAQPVMVVCAHCGKEFPKYRGKSSLKVKHHLCSKECEKTWRSNGGNPSGTDHPEYNSVEVPCATCGKILTRNRYRLRDWAEQYCNRQCAGKSRARRYSESNHPRWRGGYQPGYRGPNWEVQAAAARKRDGYRCQKCGISQKRVGRKLDVHHAIPFRSFGYIPGKNDNYLQANELSNLISLCPTCHRLTESGSTSVQLPLLAIA